MQASMAGSDVSRLLFVAHNIAGCVDRCQDKTVHNITFAVAPSVISHSVVTHIRYLVSLLAAKIPC